MPDDTAPAARTLLDVVRRQADRYGDKPALEFSADGDGEDGAALSFRELDGAARAIAAHLQAQGAAGRRVLVLCRPGLDCIAGFFGCIYAGAIAVPVHERLAPRLMSVIPDAQVRFVLATRALSPKVKNAIDALIAAIDRQPARWCLADATAGDAAAWAPPDIDGDAIAMVQYTSGSSRSSRGVGLTHANLVHNVEATRRVWGGDDRAVGVSWLPPHHYMGLIGGIVQMLHIGATAVLMSPEAFVKRPARWLEAIARRRGTYTLAPNFAYQLCVERSSADERAALDLSSLSVAMIGAEPVRAATVRGFTEAFAPAGFRPEALVPVYGLAEATMLVSGASSSPVPRIDRFDRAALGADRVADAGRNDADPVELVGCGRPGDSHLVVIVDPATRRACHADAVGEIWVAGPGVARGYLGRSAETRQAFSAFVADTEQGPFLQTGDLGFIRSGELFVTGRCDELVCIAGTNYFPRDLEATVQQSHPALRSGRGAVFAARPKPDAAEQLVVAQESDHRRVGDIELGETVAAVQTAMRQHHKLEPDSIMLFAPGRIPTTEIDRIDRDRCRQQYLDGDLETTAEWHAPLPPADPGAENLPAAMMNNVTRTRGPEAAARLAERIGAAQSRQRPTPGHG